MNRAELVESVSGHLYGHFALMETDEATAFAEVAVDVMLAALGDRLLPEASRIRGEVHITLTQPKDGRVHVIVQGVGRYPDGRLRSLAESEFDADTIAAALRAALEGQP